MNTRFFLQTKFVDTLYDHLVPRNHRIRKLLNSLDFSFVNQVSEKYYKNDEGGAPAESPERIIRMFFLLFYEGIRSETQLVERVSTDAAYRLFCRFHIDDRVPDHSTLYAFRKRLGPDGFREIFSRIMLQCMEKGLVNGKKLMFDCTDINSRGTPYSKYRQALILAQSLLEFLNSSHNPSRESPDMQYSPEFLETVSRVASQVVDFDRPPAVEKGLKQIVATQGKSAPQTPAKPDDSGNPDDDEPPKQGQPRVQDNPGNLPDEDALTAIAQEIRKDLPHTPGDPDARTGHTSSDKSFTGYLAGVMSDGKHQIITSVELYPGNAPQITTIIDAMKSYRENVAVHLPPAEDDPLLLADSASDYMEVYEEATKNRFNAVFSLRRRPSLKGKFSSDRFTMGEDGHLKCPAGHTMKRSQKPDRDGAYSYYGGSRCADCPLKSQCTDSDKGRTVQVNPSDLLHRQERLELSKTDEYRKNVRSRMAIEGVFGDGKTYRNLGRALYRGKEMVLIQLILWAGVHNLLKIFRYGSRAGEPALRGFKSPAFLGDELLLAA